MVSSQSTYFEDFRSVAITKWRIALGVAASIPPYGNLAGGMLVVLSLIL
jgi:hypothetical protein